jgi:sirohydrochlorin ferrochelatase
MADSDRVGVLVMAHGGSDSWNRTVMEAVEPLTTEMPLAVSFGMADPQTMRAAIDSLRADGVRRVAVVRLFLSGRSFLDQTEYLLGLSATPPETFMLMGGHGGAHDTRPIDHGIEVATHAEGLMTSPEAARIVAERARSAGHDPSDESLLLVAHGMGDDDENEEVRRAMEAIIDDMSSAPYAAVAVATLREDWAEKRAEEEARIRRFVEDESRAGRRVIVVPMRLSGFGPYAEVLAGLEYAPAEGLLPHEAITDWIRSTAARVACAQGWTRGCPEEAPRSGPRGNRATRLRR